VVTNSAYGCDYDVTGFIAAKYPQLAFKLPKPTRIADRWQDRIHKVVTTGEESCELDVSPGRMTARIQVDKVEFTSRHSGKISVLPRLLEIQIPVS
jgi:hypothetical protein